MFDAPSYLLGKKASGGIGVKYEVVEELPTTGEEGVIYLVPKSTSKTDNVYNEYMYINSNWELIGDTEADLTDYVKNTDYASTQDAGVIKTGNGTYMNSGNFITATEYTYANYQNAVNGTFIGKGTLENVIAGKGLQTQYSTMPTASVDNLGKIVQYTGTTDSTYTHGYFYQCVSDGESTPTYSWENINVQAGGGGVSEGLPTYLVGSPTQINNIDIPLETLKAGFYKPQYEQMTIYLTKNGNRSYEIQLLNDLIIFKDYADAQVGEIFGLVPNGYNNEFNYRYIKKTSDNKGYSNDYTYISNLPNTSNYLFANKYGTCSFNGNVSFLYIPTIINYAEPTTDKDLTPKKYVDDKPTTYAGYDATKTQVLKNINGTLTWVDE